jgi:hypothetical protein
MTSLPIAASAEAPRAAASTPKRLKASIILPAYNEARALPSVLADLAAVLGPGHEIIVVDDGSTDDTLEAARQFPCRVIRHPYNRGKGAAVRTGIANAQGDVIIVMDADATYPAGAIPHMLELLRDYELVRCSRPRDTQNMPLVNRLGNRLFDALLSVSHGLEGSDHLTGLYGLQREAALKLRLEAEGFDLEAEIGIKAHIRGLRTASFAIPYRSRLGPKKLHPWRDGVIILGRIVVMFLLFNPLLTFVLPGMLVMLLAAGGAALLRAGPVFITGIGLSIHSFIIATLGMLASFQLVVFGMAASLYGVEAGYRPARWLVQLSSRPIRLGGAVLGLGMTGLALLEIARLVAGWFGDGAGIFTDTQEVVLAATALVLGLQVLSASLFLSIFAGRLERSNQPGAVEVTTPARRDE